MSAGIITIDVETRGTTDEAVIAGLREELVEQDPPEQIRGTAARVLERAGYLEHYRGMTKGKREWLEEHWGSTLLEARLEEAVERSAVDTLVAEALCVAVFCDDDELGDIYHCMPDIEEGANNAADEKSMIYLLMEDLGKAAGPETVWVGHNLRGFDLPLLIQRARRFGIRPPEHFPKWEGGRARGRIFDTMVECACARPFVSGEEAARAMGLPFKTVEWKGAAMSGERVAEALAEGAYGVIREYCLADARAERELARALTWGWRALGEGGARGGRLATDLENGLIALAVDQPDPRERLAAVVEALRSGGVIGEPVEAALLA